MSTPSLFTMIPYLTEIAIAYKNPKLIADEVLPRVPVGKQDFQYQTMPKGDAFTIPDTMVTRKGRVNEVEFGMTLTTASTVDNALDDVVPQSDIDNAPAGYDPLAHATEFVTALVDLRREQRTAALVFGSGNYASANKTTLSGTSQWSDFSTGVSHPISDIISLLDVPVYRPNLAIFGRATWSKLIQHPDVVKAANKNAGDKGVATKQAIMDIFEFEAIYVGEGWINSAEPGQTVSLSRCWGKHAAFIYRDKLANAERGVTFGFTAQFGDRFAGVIDDAMVGVRGGKRIRSGESVKELITVNDLGCMVINAVA
jgi:hypothetical protein